MAIAADGADGLEVRGWPLYSSVEEGLVRTYGVAAPVESTEDGWGAGGIGGVPAGVTDARRIEALCPANWQPAEVSE